MESLGRHKNSLGIFSLHDAGLLLSFPKNEKKKTKRNLPFFNSCSNSNHLIKKNQSIGGGSKANLIQTDAHGKPPTQTVVYAASAAAAFAADDPCATETPKRFCLGEATAN